MNRYTAFISYRHLTPDAEVAQRLHRYIENFAVPAAMRKTAGKRRLGRVFRDEEELPLSPSLGDDIHRALEASDWLICVCSPKYLESRWCQEELRYFLSLGRKDRVLTLLTEGEPENAFPEELRFRTVDGKTVETEPLAADVRAANLAGALKKLRKEKLRIIAPILGVQFDDLRQRARRRRIRIISAAAAAAFLLLAGFLGYAVMKNREITAERNSALTAESQWLAKSAEEALAAKDRTLSLQLALAALPADFSRPERPVTEPALAALRNAVLYDKGDSGYYPGARIEVPGLESFRLMDNMLVCFSRRTEGFISAYDLASGREFLPPYTLEEEPLSCFFSDSGHAVLAYPDRIVKTTGLTSREGKLLMDDLSAAYVPDEDGNLVKRQFRDSYPPFRKLVSAAGGGGILLSGSYPYPVLSWYQIYEQRYRDYRDVLRELDDAVYLNVPGSNGSLFAVGGYRADGAPAHEPVILELKLSAAESGRGPMASDHGDIRTRYYLDPEMLEPYRTSKSALMTRLAASCDGSILAAYGSTELCFWQHGDPEMRAAFDPRLIGRTEIRDVRFSPADPGLLGLLSKGGALYLYDCRKNEIRLEIRAGLENILAFDWSPGGDKLLAALSGGTAQLFSAKDGSLLQALDCPFPVKEASFSGEQFIVLRSGDQVQVDILRAADETGTPLTRWIDDWPAGTETKTGGTGRRFALSPDGSTLWVVRDNGVTLYDAETLEAKQEIPLDAQDRAAFDEASGSLVYEKAQGPYVRLRMEKGAAWLYAEGTDCAGYVRVYDPGAGTETANFRVSYPHVRVSGSGGERKETDRSGTLAVSGLVFSGDRPLVLVRGDSETDPFAAVFRTDTFAQCWIAGYDSVSRKSDPEGARVFPAAKEWEDPFTMRAYFLGTSGSVLCEYSAKHEEYNNDYSMAAFEVRDAETGAVTAEITFPGRLQGYRVLPDLGRIVAQYPDNRTVVLSADTGEEIASFDGPGALKAAEADGGKILLTFAGLTSYSVNPRILVSAAGETARAPEGEPPAAAAGRFGPYTFIPKADGLYDAESGGKILDLAGYTFATAWEDGSRILCRSGDYYAVIRYAEPARLREIALELLDGKQMTEAQRRQYFLSGPSEDPAETRGAE